MIVSGAGPAGSFAAYKCAKGGLKVLLLDKASLQRRKCCAGGLLGRATKVLDFTLPESVIEREVKGFSFVVDGSRYRFPIGKGLAVTVRREVLDAYLISRAEKQGVEAIMESKVTQAVESDRGVKISTARGEFEARFLVLANGASSPLADAMFGRQRGKSRAIGCAVEVMSNRSPRDEIDLHITSYSRSLRPPHFFPLTGAVFPLRSSTMVSFVANKRPKADFTRAIAKVICDNEKEYGEARMVEEPCFHPLPIVPRHRLHSSRTLVVGDAAGLVSSFSGEGLTSAFLSAELASRVLIEARGEARPQLLRYDAMCNEIILPRLRAAGFLSPILHYAVNVIGHERLFSNLQADDELIGYCSAFAQGEIGIGRLAREVTQRIPTLVLGR